MLHIDKKYIAHISSRLSGFKWLKSNLAVCRCPVCGDSRTDKTKKRFYFYPSEDKQSYSIKCWNCDHCSKFSTFLKQYYPEEYSEYSLECFEAKGVTTPTVTVTTPKPVHQLTKLKLDIPRICDLPTTHPGVQYVMGRMIPRDKWQYIHYTENFAEFAKKLDPSKENLVPDCRLVLPCYTEDGQLIGVNSRALDKSTKEKYKYLAVRADHTRSGRMYFGLERLKKDKTVFCLEGHIDQLFLNNAIACGNLGFIDPNELPIPQNQIIIAFDLEPRSPEMIKTLKKMLTAGYRVALLPHEFLEVGKDINDWIKAGITSDEIEFALEKYSYVGLAGLLELQRWSKC